MSRRLLWILAMCLSALPAQTPAESLQIQQLENRIKENPGDADAHEQLSILYSLARKPDQRAAELMWLIENHPDSNILVTAVGMPRDPKWIAQAESAWRVQIARKDLPPLALAAAAQFFILSDSPAAWKLLDRALAIAPHNYLVTRVRGTLDAYLAMGVSAIDQFDLVSGIDPKQRDSDLAKAARAELETTTNAGILSAAAGTLTRATRLWPPPAGWMSFAEVCIERTLKLAPADPSVRSNAITFYSSAARRAEGAEKWTRYEKALTIAGPGTDRLPPLRYLCDDEFKAGRIEAAAAHAREILRLAPDLKLPRRADDQVHTANTVLGRIALKNGDIEQAKVYLLASGRVQRTPVLSSFGPSMELARELLLKDQKETVIEYLDSARSFWTSGQVFLAAAIEAIHNGGYPDLRSRNLHGYRDQTGQLAPLVKLHDLKGAEFRLADYAGKTVVLDFWTTWCKPCREQMPTMEKLSNELAGRGVVMIAVNVDEDTKTINGFLDKNPLSLRVVLASAAEAERFQVSAFPTVVVVGPDGKIAGAHVGLAGESALRALIERK